MPARLRSRSGADSNRENASNLATDDVSYHDATLDRPLSCTNVSRSQSRLSINGYELTPAIRAAISKHLIVSRLVVIVVQFLACRLLPDFPTDAFKGAVPPPEKTNIDSCIEYFLGGFANWDSQHFFHVAEYGYTWESELAFFPLFPATLRVFGDVIRIFLPAISVQYSMLVAGVLMNNVAVIASGHILLELTLYLTHDLRTSFLCVVVFCWNPASVFFSTCYTESLFTLFTLIGLCCLEADRSNRPLRFVAVALCFAFTLLTRSNGFLNGGYIAFYLVVDAILTSNEQRQPRFALFNTKTVANIVKAILLIFICICIIVLPLRLYGILMEATFCNALAVPHLPENLENYIANNDVVLPGDVEQLDWCNKFSLLTPAFYQSVQKKYWDVGLFGYWQIRKIPNFLLAAPAIFLTFYGFGIIVMDFVNHQSISRILGNRSFLLPYAVHSCVIAIAGIMFYNVEVTTRILFSSSPFLNIVLARIIASSMSRDDISFRFPYIPWKVFTRKWSCFMILIYLSLYVLFGTAAHAAWLPFV